MIAKIHDGPGSHTCSLLDEVRHTDIRDHPYAHVEKCQAVDPDYYRELIRYYPPLEAATRGRTNFGSNQAVRIRATEVIDNPDIAPIWREFFRYHVSQSWWNDIVRAFGREIGSAHPSLEKRVGRRLEDWRVAVRGDGKLSDVQLDCQFVFNTPVTSLSSVKGPHVDKRNKIFSALFYCRDDNDDSRGGDLNFYRFLAEPRFDFRSASSELIEQIKTVSYAQNKLVAFVNSPYSVHSVTPRCVTSIPRRYINLIVETPYQAFTLPQMRLLARLRYWVREREFTRTYNS